MKKLFALLLVAVLSVSIVACDNNEQSNSKVGAIDIVIYAGGSSEFSWPKGTKEDEVINYIEDKYYNDTGVRLNFKTNTELGKTMKENIITDVTEGKVDIVISHNGGGVGVDDWSMENGLFYDLDDYINEYLSDYVDDGYFKWSDGDTTLDGLKRMTTSNGEIIGIPSVINPYKFGILVRKDWMNAAGYTDDASDTTKTYVGDFETFTEMALKIKTQQNLGYAITGAIFDVEKAGLLGACGVNAGYYTNTVYSESSKVFVGPGYINPKYAEVLKIENDWSTRGVLAADCDNILITQGENNFIAGKSAIFVQDPTVTHLIEIARRAKAANPEAEFTILGALTKDKDSTEKGFMRNSAATFGAVIPKNSKHCKDIMKFLKWMYKSEDNYLLCRYGREGVDWIYDRDNNTYNYKSDSDYVNVPYSGILSLVENQSIKNLSYGGYSADEKKWIEISQRKENYVNNDTVDYFLYTQNKELLTIKGNQAVYISQNAIRPIWFAKDGYSDVDSIFTVARNNYVSNAEPYLTAMYNIYNNLRG